MGSSTKKKDRERNRDEKKKKRHRSRSRSRERHHRHHHKKRKQRSRKEEKSPSPSDVSSISDLEHEIVHIHDDEVEEIRMEKKPRLAAPLPPVVGRELRVPAAQPAPSISHSPPRSSSFAGSGGGGGNQSGDISLSIEETNLMRAKLGLKPLQVSPVVVSEADLKEEGDNSETIYEAGKEVHRPAESITQKLQVDKLREKIAAHREKRKQKQKYSTVKTLGYSDEEDEGAAAWIMKSRIIQKEKQEAEKRNKMLEEMDAQFGIGDIVEEELHHQKSKAYTSKNLKGLSVEHSMDRFDDGRTTILTLKDSNILGDDGDTLVNVNIVDDERTEKNLKNRLKKSGPLDYDTPEMDEEGHLMQKAVLTKYDEEIEGEQKNKFRLGARGQAVADGVKRPAPGPSKLEKLRKFESLSMPESQLAAEYMTQGELLSKKFKKKKKKKKKFTVDDLTPLDDDMSEHLGNRASRREAVERSEEQREPVSVHRKSGISTLRKLMEEEDEEEEEKPPGTDDVEMLSQPVSEEEDDDAELQEALNRTRKRKLLCEVTPSHEKVAHAVTKLKTSAMDSDEAEMMILNRTDEFCRTLGENHTYGLAGNRTEEEESLQLQPQPEVVEQRGAWEEVDIDESRVEISDAVTAPILEEEPEVAKGVAGALMLAAKKGYLSKESDAGVKSSSTGLHHLKAHNYSIDDKQFDDDRRGGRDRYMGPAVTFREKDNYRPEVRLEYIDDEGRKLCAKEAFRYLSHKFHGKGSGKNKTEKRMKKWQEEALMKHMSSSDTPLHTVERLIEKQKQVGAPYLVLSGNKSQTGDEGLKK